MHPNTLRKVAPSSIPAQSRVPDNHFDPHLLCAIADLAETRGDVGFSPGGGLLFDTPATKAERMGLPIPVNAKSRFLDLPQDRYQTALKADSAFQSFVDAFTIPHVQPGYRLVVIPLTGRLSPSKLRAIGNAAETFGHGVIRVTPDVSIRLPNVPTALLRPLHKALVKAGLLTQATDRIAA